MTPNTEVGGRTLTAPVHAERDVQTLAGGSLLSLAGTVGRGVLGYVLVLVVARALGPSGAGLFFQAVALFTMLLGIEMGAPTGLVRFIARDIATGRVADIRSSFRFAVTPVTVASLVLGAVVFVAAPAIASFLFEGSQVATGTLAIRVLTLVLPFSAVGELIASGSRGFGTVLPYITIESLGKPALRVVLVSVAFWLDLGPLWFVVAWAVPGVFGLPAATVWFARLLQRVERASRRTAAQVTDDRRTASEFWGFCLPQGVSALFLLGLRWSDILLVGALGSAAEAGIYGAVSRTVMFGMFVIEAVRLAIAPQLSALLGTENRDRAENVYRVATWWLMMASWPLYVALAVWAPVVLALFGREFVAGQDALSLISLGMLLSTGTGNVSVVLLMGGKSPSVLLFTSIALAVNLSLNVILIPRFGMDGAAVAWVIGIAISNLLALWQVWRQFRMAPFGRGFLVVGLGSLVCFGGLGALGRSVFGATISGLIVSNVIALVCYVGILGRFRRELHLSELWAGVRRRSATPQMSPSGPEDAA
jgi:O-antigen/teichoic acid export membrane protein